MITILKEYSSDDVSVYRVDYFTYYRDANEYRTPLYVHENYYDGPYSSDIDNILLQFERDIDIAVTNGDYPGFWVHHIKIVVRSNEEQRDVDYWTGSTWVDEEDCDIEAEELDIPEDWDANFPNYEDLANEAEILS